MPLNSDSGPRTGDLWLELLQRRKYPMLSRKSAAALRRSDGLSLKMPLAEIWEKSLEQSRNKTVQQILVFAGDDHLKDGNATSAEFRDYLAHIEAKTGCDEIPVDKHLI